MNISQGKKNKLGQILVRLVPNFDGQVLAYNDYEIVWKDSRPQPSEEEIVAEYDSIMAEENGKRIDDVKKAQEKEKLQNIDLESLNSIDDVKEVLKSLVTIQSEEKPQSVKPSDAVESRLFIGGVRVK